MTDAVTFTPEDPEQGWPPFLEWLTAHGLDPDRVTKVVVAGGEVIAEVRDVPLTIIDGEMVCSTVCMPLQSPPPRWREVHA